MSNDPSNDPGGRQTFPPDLAAIASSVLDALKAAGLSQMVAAHGVKGVRERIRNDWKALHAQLDQLERAHAAVKDSDDRDAFVAGATIRELERQLGRDLIRGHFPGLSDQGLDQVLDIMALAQQAPGWRRPDER